MGKLLQKIVNNVVPSWLTRIKSSTHAATKRLLPPASRAVHGRSIANEPCVPAPASTESSVLSFSIDTVAPPPASTLKETNTRQNDSKHKHCDGDDDHHEWPSVKHILSHPDTKPEFQFAEEKHLDLLGSKRKSTYSEDSKDEEEARGEGHRSRQEWKRRKREEGLMNCELPRSVCKVVGNGKAVVKYTLEPDQAMWESMVEMIVGNGLWEVESLEFLLFCYLSLNEAHLYSMIQSSFLKVLKDLGRTF